MQLQDMYQEIILDHYRNPHHKGLRDPFDAQVYHVNPTCGDEVTLRVALKGETRAAARRSSRTSPSTPSAARSARRAPR